MEHGLFEIRSQLLNFFLVVTQKGLKHSIIYVNKTLDINFVIPSLLLLAIWNEINEQ